MAEPSAIVVSGMGDEVPMAEPSATVTRLLIALRSASVAAFSRMRSRMAIKSLSLWRYTLRSSTLTNCICCHTLAEKK